MIEQVSTAITFVAFFYDATNDQGATGLTVTVDVRRVSDTVELVTAANATEIGDGFYKYTLAAGSTGTESGYVAVFKTNNTDVSQRHIPAMWCVGVAGVEDLDQSLSTTESNIRGADGDDLEDISDQIDALNNLSSADVNAACDTALTDYDGPTNAEMVARTVASASYATAANQTTILNRIGAFTGSGVNTILGFLRAIMRSDTSTPSDVGGTYDDATDSQQAIRDVLASNTITVVSVVDGDVITIVRGDTLSADIDGLGDISNYTELWFTVKRDRDDADSASIIQVLLTNPTATGDGLQYLNGASATASQGSITVDDDSAGDITVTVDETATAQLAEQACTYDVQVLRSTGVVKTLTTGECRVDADADVTRATS